MGLIEREKEEREGGRNFKKQAGREDWIKVGFIGGIFIIHIDNFEKLKTGED